jgi:hypothetical protein
MFTGRIARVARAIGIMLLTVGVLAACSSADDRLSFEDLSANELDSLYYMREEEKLARDVYLALYEVWRDQIFSNIAASEQTHTDAVKALIDKYNLIDPAAGNPPGVFTDPKFQLLYDQLVAFGTQSRINALMVGVQIEELDIKDIAGWLALVERGDIITVYTSLLCGSRNHLRSYYPELIASGGSYVPVHITQAEFDAIVSSPMETCG